MKSLNTLRHYGCRTLTALVALVCFVFTQCVWADNLYFVHTDHLGTPVVITDGTQATVWQGDKTPFGETTTTTNQIAFNVRFPGQYYDAESGLHYNYFRDYDPSLGRYVQPDPIGIMRDYSDPRLQVAINSGVIEETENTGELLNHLYGYVDQNPLNWYDPFGLAKKYEKPENPNKRKGADDRKKSGDRERNVGHPEGEEHSRRPKGGFRPRTSAPLFVPFPEEILRELVRPPSNVPPIPMPESC